MDIVASDQGYKGWIRVIITLSRSYLPSCTLGRLDVEGQEFGTVEKAWIGNESWISCIPEGIYKVKRYSSVKYPNVWELQDVPQRSKILIHAGNTASDVQGCIAIGMSISDTQQSVVSSRIAIGKLHAILPDEFDIRIKAFTVEYP